MAITSGEWLHSLGTRTPCASLLLLVLLGALLIGFAAAYAPGQDAEAKEQADIVRTLLRGLEYREGQVSGLFGEAILDTYYGGTYWPSLERISDAVRETPAEARRDRDRVAVRFDVTHLRYRLEAQSIYWGGANCFFVADPRGDAWDVGNRHQIRGITESGISYQITWSRGYPIAHYHRAECTDPLSCGKWPTRWLGLVDGAQRFSAAVRERIDNALGYDCVRDERPGLACLRLTLHIHQADSDDISRIRYWFVPEYDCALVRKESIHYSLDPAHANHRSVTEWRDFQEVAGLASVFPRRWTHYSFVYGTSHPNALDSVRDVHMTALSTEPPPEDDLWHTLFPPGARLGQPPVASSNLTPDYKAKMIETTAIQGEAYFWAKKQWKEVIPAFPEEWLKGIDAETIADLFAGAGVQQVP